MKYTYIMDVDGDYVILENGEAISPQEVTARLAQLEEALQKIIDYRNDWQEGLTGGDAHDMKAIAYHSLNIDAR